MSRNYKFHNSQGLYFVGFAVVYWLDVFTRNEYKDILLQSLSFCQKEKGMEIVAWCIMTNQGKKRKGTRCNRARAGLLEDVVVFRYYG